jgi:N-acetylglutamate synthase-like GNAT family acetyltransferase
MKIKITEFKSSSYELSRELRNSILLAPLGIAPGSFEAYDNVCCHIVAVEETASEKVVGCVLLKPEEEGVGRLMQMAVSTNQQRKGIGLDLVKFLCTQAKKLGYSEVICRSRDYAMGFYEKLGFVAYGEPFDEAGISHTNMRYNLSPSE